MVTRSSAAIRLDAGHCLTEDNMTSPESHQRANSFFIPPVRTGYSCAPGRTNELGTVLDGK
jgi:hypothetical protein